jgi:carbohydrate kinase (thermoresistant glucokinase family)
MLIVLFGKPGCGKNFIGKIMKDEFGFYFFDGDDCLTAKMKKRISKGIIITKKMRREFYGRLTKKISKLSRGKNRLVVAQAIPIEKYRELILKKFPQAKLILVSAKDAIIKNRLLTRKHLADADYCKKINKLFEKPKIKYQKIINDAKGKLKIKIRLKKTLSGC